MGFNEYSAQAPEDLSSISKQRGLARVVLQLEPKHLSSSASRWKLDHLVAYRLLVSPGSDFLPILGDHQDHCPLCNDGGPSYTQRLDNVRVQALVGDGAHRLNTKTQRELMQSPDGFFWVALARAAYTEPANQPREQPPRERRPPEREGFVSSVSAIPGSSSPTQPSSSEFEPDEEVSEDENEARRGKPEEVTVHLVICFLQHALSLCLVQHSADAAAVFEVRPRVERRISTARIDDDVDIKAEDDGGIYKVARTALGWETANPYLALLEAKKAFKHIHFDERTGSHLPIVSNEYLAQCFGEAVIAWKANQQWLRRGVFLIAATSTFVRFVHFKFGRRYMEYLDAADEEAQIRLVDNNERGTCVRMRSTRWFNLQEHWGRRMSLCHVFSLLRWHDAQQDSGCTDELVEESDEDNDMDIDSP